VLNEPNILSGLKLVPLMIANLLWEVEPIFSAQLKPRFFVKSNYPAVYTENIFGGGAALGKMTIFNNFMNAITAYL